MGEQTTIYATARCGLCGTSIEATRYHQDQADATTVAGPAFIPGLVHWAGWRHLPSTRMSARRGHVITPGAGSIELTAAGRAVLDPAQAPGCGFVGHPVTSHICQTGGVPESYPTTEKKPGARDVTISVMAEPAPVHRYPHRVNWSDVEAFLRGIGVDPIDRETLMEIRIAPHGVEFTRARVLPGRKVRYLTTDRRASMDDADAARQVTTAQIRWNE